MRPVFVEIQVQQCDASKHCNSFVAHCTLIVSLCIVSVLFTLTLFIRSTDYEMLEFSYCLCKSVPVSYGLFVVTEATKDNGWELLSVT